MVCTSLNLSFILYCQKLPPVNNYATYEHHFQVFSNYSNLKSRTATVNLLFCGNCILSVPLPPGASKRIKELTFRNTSLLQNSALHMSVRLYKHLPLRIKKLEIFNQFRKEVKSILLNSLFCTPEEYLQAILV